MDSCECAECKAKRKAAIEAIELAEQKFDHEYAHKIYSMGVPKAKIKEILESVKKEVS